MKRASTLLIFGCSLLLGKTPFAGETGLSDRQRATHLLDRLAFGARPGEVEKLSSQGPAGIARWIERQLHPQTIADDAMEAKLAKLPAIRMNAKELLENFRRPEDVALEMGVKKEDFQKDEELKKKVREKIGQEKLPEEINRELAAQRLIRAVESRRELQEVLVDFWMNHFNIDISKGEERWLLPDFESRVIRPRIFGKFSELLKATTRSPAMLFYLDNHLSESPLDYAGKNGPVPKKNGRGLNENYAREILELHTLGVEGGYDQTDVTELARILTGWSIEDPHKSPEFKFKEKIHDRGGKSFLGSRFDPGHGID